VFSIVLDCLLATRRWRRRVGSRTAVLIEASYMADFTWPTDPHFSSVTKWGGEAMRDALDGPELGIECLGLSAR